VRYAESLCRQGAQEELKLAVFGASGFSREVADILLTSGVKELVFVDLSPIAHQYFGFPIFDESCVPKLKDQGFIFVIGVGDNKARKRIFEKFPSLPYPNFIHSSASMGFKQFDMLKNRRGNIITAGVRFTNNIQIGDFGIYNLNSTVGHDCMIEDFVNLAPGVNISGNVHMKEGAYVGTNASIFQGKAIDEKLEIGAYATIGAGAVVLKSVKSFDTVVGVPARSKT
jgi:sugar O-acyltransferase (sialic acid O-acetyltransferase NeuD family)